MKYEINGGGVQGAELDGQNGGDIVVARPPRNISDTGRA